MTRCTWCHARRDDLRTVSYDWGDEQHEALVCDDDCERPLREFIAFASTHVPHFLIGLIGLPLVGLVLTFLLLSRDGGAIGLAVVGAGLGGTIIKYPFVTPQTIELLGVKRSITVARWMGAACILGGLVAAVVVYQQR